MFSDREGTSPFYLKYDMQKKDLILLAAETVIMAALAFFSVMWLYPMNIHMRSNVMASMGNYTEAIALLDRIEALEDNTELITEYTYLSGITMMQASRFDEAKEIFEDLREYRDSAALIQECNYQKALALLEEKDYEKACGYLLALNDYKDSAERYFEAVCGLTKGEQERGEYELFYDHFSIIKSLKRFDYDLLEKPDMKEVISLTDTTSVNIYGSDLKPESSYDYYTGEAAVYRITPEKVYFLSAKHVLSNLQDADVSITFYDGTTLNTDIDIYVSDNEDSDLGMFTVDSCAIPLDILLNLKEVNYLPSHYSTLRKGNPAVILSNYWYGKSDLLSETSFVGTEVNRLSDGNFPDRYYLAFERCSVEGQSGSPVFDEQGRCLAIVSGFYFYEIDGNITFTIDCYSRLDEAEELFLTAMSRSSS
ncbi:MAG: hypothetical protein K5886_11930 [Lachnospiraceae bacterium]|nr:hypothetical protein [Lachnospiraceae bacterium]